MCVRSVGLMAILLLWSVPALAVAPGGVESFVVSGGGVGAGGYSYFTSLDNGAMYMGDTALLLSSQGSGVWDFDMAGEHYTVIGVVPSASSWWAEHGYTVTGAYDAEGNLVPSGLPGFRAEVAADQSVMPNQLLDGGALVSAMLAGLGGRAR